MPEIQNQASLTYLYGGTNQGTALSNVATTNLEGPVTINKTALQDTYRGGTQITYIVTITNSGECGSVGYTLTDDLGTFTNGTCTSTPLNYVGPAQLYVGGQFYSVLTPTVAQGLVTFDIPALPCNTSAMLIYVAEVNECANLAVGASIENTVTLTGGNLCESLTDTNVIDVAVYADVDIIKSMTPNPFVSGGTLTYTFDLFNYGNTEATDIVLTDVFNPAPESIAITVNGEVLSPALYSYTNGVLTIPATAGVTIPAADFVLNNCCYATTAGQTQIVVTGVVRSCPTDGVTTNLCPCNA